ncbi:hypothetical protein OGAPHI_005969 [Ogataea philodendri]|uniref:Serine/threonine-protein phosphatase 2A activator n=1 Tax=Ogataea philodendri TaxID=1378263 RepID=A0A9P8T1K6_9ASCO|nr:uncharacterized protein OGAPHI_005969 [Ogataea philodendri]KAH3661791.1 hypothetical protein OGAPHI_005969 [Ogataea philodendri]
MVVPTKRLKTPEDLKIFQSSPVYNDLVTFVTELAASVHGLELGYSEGVVSKEINQVLELLENINSIVDHHPVVKETTSRFGKVEFRDFYDELAEKLVPWVEKYVDQDNAQELSAYILNSFGDRTRIDYGSGHELNFACFLLCLYKLEIFTKDDFKWIVLKVFKRYLQLMRRLQLLYWLEPAGSHGVWGLDDYHFLPFLFGAAQLAPFTRPRPLTIHNKDYVEEFKDKYLYFGCIAFINQVKTGAESLRWHSPMLDDISGVKTWAKIEEGMIKMYKAEVLGKLPVVQHFLFGSILKCPEGIPSYTDGGDDEHVGHNHSTWGDCCGIKVPSAAAASAMSKHHIPFD